MPLARNAELLLSRESRGATQANYQAPTAAPPSAWWDALRFPTRRAVLFVAFAALLLVAGCGGGGSTANTSAVGPKQDKLAAGFERCPRRALAALPLNAAAEKSAKRIAKGRVGRSPQITIRVRLAPDAGARGHEVRFLCGPKIARRAVVVFTYDHRYDRGPNKSASLARHALVVSRFADGYGMWYVEH